MSSTQVLPTHWTRLLEGNKGPLTSLIFVTALLLGSLLALPFDHRIILGLNPWIKPIKFDLSSIIYVITVAILLSLLKDRQRSRNLIGWGIAVAMIVENTIITLQSWRGVPSHMNYTSLFNGVAFGIMGILITINTLLLAWLFTLYCTRTSHLPPALVWGIRLGLLAILAGSLEGALIVQHGAHTVGAADGLSGLPFVNWSRGYGDLRVPHFFALHALQAMPLIGWGLSRTRLSAKLQVLAMVGAATVYLTGVYLLFVQAMSGRPFVP